MHPLLRFKIKSIAPLLSTTLALFALPACDGCAVDEPYDGPCTYVYGNGEPADRYQTWNHAQLSAQPQHDVMTTMAVVTGGDRGGYVMGGMRDGQTYVVLNDARGIQRTSYTHDSAFSELVTLATGIRTNNVAVSIARGQVEADDRERAVISMANFASDGADPKMFAPRPVIAADGIDAAVLAGRSVESEVVTAALVRATTTASVVGGLVTLSGLAPDNVPTTSFYLSTISDRAARDHADQGLERFPMEQTHLFAVDDTRGQNITTIVEESGGGFAVLLSDPEQTPVADRAPQRLLRLSAFDALTDDDATGIELLGDEDQGIMYANVQSSDDGLLLVGNNASGNGVVTLLRPGGERTTMEIESERGPAMNDATFLPEQIVAVGTTTDAPQQVFLAAFDLSLTEELWRQTYKDGMGDTEFVTGHRILPDGDTGSFWVGGDTNFEHSPIRGYGGNTDGYVHRFDHIGREWGRRIPYCRERSELEGRTFDPDNPIQ